MPSRNGDPCSQTSLIFRQLLQVPTVGVNGPNLFNETIYFLKLLVIINYLSFYSLIAFAIVSSYDELQVQCIVKCVIELSFS